MDRITPFAWIVLKTGVKSLLGIVLLLVACVTSVPAWAQARSEEDLRGLEKNRGDERAARAVRNGLKWLAGRQVPADGRFGDKLPHAYTALGCLALMAAGEQPGRSQYGRELQRGLMYLAGRAKKNNGYLGGDGSRMYGHGISILALCEGYGMLDSPEANRQLGEAIDLALAVTFKAQANEQNEFRGGWRYDPGSKDADLSVTGWQILSLRAARNCGFTIPEAVMESALDYVRHRHSGAGFAYQKDKQPTSSMQAAGIVCMKLLGADQSEADKAKIATAAKALETIDPSQGHRFYYQSFYLATAFSMLQTTDENNFNSKLTQSLLRLQQKDGQFAKHQGHDGGIYSTAFAVVCLSVPYQYLPILQE